MLGLSWNELGTLMFPVKRGSTRMPMLKRFVHKALMRRIESGVYESEQFLYVGGQTGVRHPPRRMSDTTFMLKF